MKNITPLILQSKRSAVKNDEYEDLFATLFSPPTPPASPNPHLLFDTSMSSSKQSIHSRKVSTASSDFGSFVSVSAFDDPLQSEQLEPFTPLHNLGFFEKFTDSAVKSNQHNKKLLEELLEHEDDPLYWVTANPSEDVENRRITSGNVTPILRTDSPQAIPQKREDSSSSLIDFDTPPASSHSSRVDNENDPPSSLLGNQTLTSRWLSSIKPTGPSSSSFTNVTGYFDQPLYSQSPLHLSTASSLKTSPTNTLRSLPEITHGTPFSSQIYTPPSGAPGFAGDRHWNKSNFEYDSDTVNRRSVRLVGRKEMTTPTLTVEQADMIRPFLPALRRLANSWTLLYSLDQHGISLNTLYARCMGHLGGALVVMKDSDEKTFGVWVGEAIKPSKGAYYGSGESFLWKVKDHSNLKVFKWTGRNDYVALCEPEYLSFGGGDGKYGLYLDGSLLDGSSACCPTFNNEPLCSDAGHRQGDNVKFECVGLEVWGVSGS